MHFSQIFKRNEAIDIALIYFIVVFENNAFIAPYGKKKLVIYLSIEIRRLIEKIIVFDGWKVDHCVRSGVGYGFEV